MKRFKKIIFYTQGNAEDRPALERAAELARLNHGQLTVVGVLQSLSRELRLLLPTTPPADLQELAVQEFRAQLEQLAEPVRQPEIAIGVDVLCGVPFLEVIRAVVVQQFDLVILTAEGSGLKQPLFGSTSLRLMRKCPCPVWVIKAGPHRRFQRILAAVNPDPDDEEHRGVNSKIMELATSLAHLEGSELRVVHAWDFQGEATLRRWHKHLPAADVDRIVHDTESRHGAWLNELLAQYPLTGIPHNVHLLRGEPAQVIINLAAKNGIDLIIMGTVGRTGIPGFLIGNTAESVLGQVNCSVLTVKPEGFVSPVIVSKT